MSSSNLFKVELSSRFVRGTKKLAKKYRSIKDDIANLVTELKKCPSIGDEMCEHIYKIRLPISSKNKGKSSGARIITAVIVNKNTVILVDIYEKSAKQNLSLREINALKKLFLSEK